MLVVNNITNSLSKNYLKIGFNHRFKILEKNKNVNFFLDNLLPKERKTIKKIFLNGEADYHEMKNLVNWMLDNSELFRQVKNRQSDEKIFSFLYRMNQPVGIDDYYIKSPAGKQIFYRLKSMEKNLPLIIENLQKKFPHEKIRVFNFFSGLAVEWIKILKNNRSLIKKLIIKNIDNDPAVCEKGSNIVKKNGLESSIQFECKDFKKVDMEKIHLVVLVGVLCSLSDNVQSKLLQVMHAFVHQEGYLITSVPTLTMIKRDPFTDMLMSLIGWNMKYKTREMIKALANKNGWDEKKIFYDNKKFHCISVFSPSTTLFKEK